MAPGSSVVINRPSVIFDTQGEETVVIDLGTGRYFRLDGPSTRVWRLFEGAVEPRALVEASDDPSTVGPQIERIVAELRDAGLLRAATDDDPGAAVEPWTFDGFTLEVFTDLEDILGLDPIHEVDAERGWPHVDDR
jgi:hypothetical protein